MFYGIFKKVPKISEKSIKFYKFLSVFLEFPKTFHNVLFGNLEISKHFLWFLEWSINSFINCLLNTSYGLHIATTPTAGRWIVKEKTSLMIKSLKMFTISNLFLEHSKRPPLPNFLIIDK